MVELLDELRREEGKSVLGEAHPLQVGVELKGFRVEVGDLIVTQVEEFQLGIISHSRVDVALVRAQSILFKVKRLQVGDRVKSPVLYHRDFVPTQIHHLQNGQV